jgi:hypothetical protein
MGEAAEVLHDEAFDGDELTDEQLEGARKGNPWVPEEEPYEDRTVIEFKKKNLPDVDPSLLPSQFTAYAFRMPTPDGQGYENFSFKGRRHLLRPYDSPAKRILMVCARQVEKSTLLGNKALGHCCLIPSYKVLYVSPSATQTKTFSGDRVKEPIDTSVVLRSFTTQMLSQNIFEKQFVNRSKVTLRYAFLNADRTRGIPAHELLLDELQDILGENIPVIEQTTSHSPEHLKKFCYSGTPKTLDNIIEYYRARLSTQGEWVIPCDRCGSSAGAGRFWNILGEKNIGKKGLICEKCGELINAQHDEAQWAWMVEDADFESYRIPQLMVPWVDWSDILFHYKTYPRPQFYNEVLGISFDSGLRPLTGGQIKACCNEDVHMGDLETYRNMSYGQDIFCGIDWGTGENSYTVICLGTYMGSKFRIFYIHRYMGEDTEPQRQLEKIVEICNNFNVRLIGADYGGGFHPNDHLLRHFGPERLQKFQYAARPKAKVQWNPQFLRWIVHRTEAMSAVFNSIKRGNVIEFPRWREFYDPYAQDMLNIFSEYNETLRMIQYDHTPGKTDDGFHSVLYCFLVSMIMHPRPDIISPTKEQGHVGPQFSNYSGPTYQG